MSKRPASRALRHEVALRLKAAISINGLTIPQAAKRLGVTRQALWLYLSEKSMPGGKVLERACRLWDLTLTVNGFRFTKESFGPQRPKQPREVQLDLFRAFAEIRPGQIETKLVRVSSSLFELRVKIKAAS